MESIVLIDNETGKERAFFSLIKARNFLSSEYIKLYGQESKSDLFVLELEDIAACVNWSIEGL